VLAGTAITVTRGTFSGSAFAQAAVTMTAASSALCNEIVPPPVDIEDVCRNYKKDNHKKHCNQGVGNGSEDCDPGNSNQGNKYRSNDEWDGKPGNPGRKGGNKK
ncbi:MAG: hypothetical protein ABIK68_14035, partial [bacterium]